MHVIRDEFDLETLADTELAGLISERIEEASAYVERFSELVFFVVVEPGDGMEAVAAAIGFSLLENRFDGTACGCKGFTPSWDVLEEHAAFYELVYVLGDDGSGVTVLVSKSEGVSADLLSMCREFAPLRSDT